MIQIMDKEKQRITDQSLKLIERFTLAFAGEKNIQADNEKTINTALIYEKIRVALEYQEEHLILKNAISRILRRHHTLSINPNSDFLYSNLISELSWSNYLNPESLTTKESELIQSRIGAYLVLLRYSKSGRFSKHELQKMIIEWLSIEIEEILRPQSENEIFVNYTYEILRKNISLENSKVSEEESEIQLKIAIYSNLLKPDFSSIQFLALNYTYPSWKTFSNDEIKKFAKSFDPYFNKVDAALNHKFKKRYTQYVRKCIAPFILYRKILSAKNINLESIKDNPKILLSMVLDRYDLDIIDAKQKVWRATIRAFAFILLTKISLAFILEIPFDRLLSGSIDYLSLLINISLPPILMIIAGSSVKSPAAKNRLIISETFQSIITENKISDIKFPIAPQKPNKTFQIFNLIYSIFTIFIVFGVIWLLIALHFNIVSILLFFFFVSVVSFFSFRIRNIALELAMKRIKDDAVTSVVELLFLPFIRIGKYFSDRFAAFNPFIIALDFLIEAPLKTIIKIVTSWFRFINKKKEDLEI